MDINKKANELIEEIEQIEHKKDIMEVARFLKAHYDAYIVEGFTHEEAMELVLDLQYSVVFCEMRGE